MIDEDQQMGFKKPTKLDPNHNYFILVDDGSKGEYGKEIKLRALLEAELRKSKKSSKKKTLSKENSIDENLDEHSIPMVLIVVQGGFGTLITIEESLKKHIPIIIIAVSFFFQFLIK